MTLTGDQLVNWKKAILGELEEIAHEISIRRDAEAALKADLSIVEARIAAEEDGR